MPPTDVSEMILTAEPWPVRQQRVMSEDAILLGVILLLALAIFRQEIRMRRRRRRA